MKLGEVPQLLTPPLLGLLARRLVGALRRRHGFHGRYRNWQAAAAASTGYDATVILEKTKAALLKVRSGEAAYERDSVLFDTVEQSWPVLAALLMAAVRSGGSLNVLDFGGSLGSTYFRSRALLSSLPQLRWNIVEQPSHVAVGRASFEDEVLRFYESIPACLAENEPTVVLMSGVLQYLEDPQGILAQVLELPSAYVVIDRTPFWDGADDLLTVETVNPSIFSASYPAWIFSESRFRAYFAANWAVLSEFSALDRLPAPVQTTWKGFIVVRTEPPVPGHPFGATGRPL